MTTRARATAAALLAALVLGAGAVHAADPAPTATSTPAATPAAPPAATPTSTATATPAGSVTFLSGQATRVSGERKEPLALGSPVFQGDTIETARRTRLELKLTDASVLRLGPVSRVELDAAAFGASPDDRKVSAKLRVGNVWANVTKALGGEARFEVKTENAVAGVRGTTFRVDASKDKSVVVRVYSGSVAVAAGAIPRPEHNGAPAAGGKPKRQQVAGPQEVTREQWERIVTNMMQVKVAADGTPSEPEKFALAEADEWETWNRQRDQAAR